MHLVEFINNLSEGFVKVPKQPWTTKEEALALANSALPAFRRILMKAAPANAVVKIAIKPVESINDKLQRWKPLGRGIDTMFDMLRGAVLVADGKEIQDVIHRLSRGPVVAKFEHKDEPKDALGYYGSYHLDLYLPEFKIVAEVQALGVQESRPRHLQGTAQQGRDRSHRREQVPGTLPPGQQAEGGYCSEA